VKFDKQTGLKISIPALKVHQGDDFPMFPLVLEVIQELLPGAQVITSAVLDLNFDRLPPCGDVKSKNFVPDWLPSRGGARFRD